MKANIRLLKKQDATILRQSLAWSRPFEKVSLKRCKEMIVQPKNIFIAALLNKKPVGLIVAYEIQRFQDDEMFLYEIDVHPDYRKKEIATQMLKYLKKVCIQNNLKEIFVFTNQNNIAAMRLYKKTGGKRSHPDDVMFIYDLTK